MMRPGRLLNVAGYTVLLVLPSKSLLAQDTLSITPTRCDSAIASKPAYAPVSVPAVLQNGTFLATRLREQYAERVEDHTVTAQVRLWILINSDGRVENALLDEPAESDILNKIALELTELMRFSSAVHRDSAVCSWKNVPISFPP